MAAIIHQTPESAERSRLHERERVVSTDADVQRLAKAWGATLEAERVAREAYEHLVLVKRAAWMATNGPINWSVLPPPCASRPKYEP